MPKSPRGVVRKAVRQPARPPMKRNATKSTSKTATVGRANSVKRGTEKAKAIKTYNSAAGRSPAQKRAAIGNAKPKPTANPAAGVAAKITPRKVTSGGDAIGAAHQSFFDIGKFLSGLGGGN